MPSPPPSAANDYHVDATHRLDPATVNAVFGSIAARLRAREELEATFNGLIAAGLAQAIAAVQNEIAPYAAEAQSKAAQIAAYLLAYQSDANPIRDAVLTALLGGVDSRGDTLAKLQAQLDAFTFESILGLPEALALKAPLDSPALTGAPTAPTAAPGANTQQIATTAFVQEVKAALLGGSGAAFDTLAELANALGNDPNLAATISAALALRLRVDAAQSLTAPQQAQGRSNLGCGVMATRASVLAADLPAGALVELAVLDAAAAAQIAHQTVLATAGYSAFTFVLDNLRSSANGDTLALEWFDGADWITSGYAYANYGHSAAGGAADCSNAATAMRVGRTAAIGNQANTGISSAGGLRVQRIAAGSYRAVEGHVSYWTSGSNFETCHFAGVWQTNTPFTGFRMRFIGGTISGRVKVMGIK